MAVVVGVDSSTSACKVLVRDVETGKVLASGRAPHPPTTPPRSEQHPHEWESALQAALAGAGVPEAQTPAAVAVGAQQQGLVVLDQAGEVLRPAKLWNDTESAEDADILVADLPGGSLAWAQACGSVPLAGFTITKLRWLARNEPATFARVASVLLPHDWLTFRLSGRQVTDRGDASGTGYWSPKEERYRIDLLELVDPDVDWLARLPEVSSPDTAVGEWTGNGALVAPGTGDNMAAGLGLGLRHGDLVLSLGTSATAFLMSDQPAADPTGTVAGFADATGHYLPLVCTMNATKVTETIARLLGVDHGRFDELALDSPPGARDLVLVPHLDGERTPNRPAAAGTMLGLRNDIEPAHLARAAIEGVVCNLLAGADSLGPTPGRVFLIGGGAHSAAYRQVVADLTGRAIIVPEEGELVATGAAVQAAGVHLGRRFDDVADAWGLGAGVLVEPDAQVDGAAIRAAFAAAMASCDR